MHGSDDLSSALDSLHQLLLTAPEVESFLHEVAVLAAGLVDPAASAGITIQYDGGLMTVASSDGLASMVDEEQYTVGQGPCLETLQTGRVVEVKDQRTDDRWGSYAPRARARGIRSSLSLPLLVDGRAVGALNLYSEEKVAAFEDGVAAQAKSFAGRASTALTLTLRYHEQARSARQLEETLDSRSHIDQAIGILMAEQRCDARTAFDLLRRHSQNSNRKLRAVAEEIITRVSGAPPTRTSPFEPGQHG
ncbi:MAG: ANTAR domain-containing protein [Nocardioides sp.]